MEEQEQQQPEEIADQQPEQPEKTWEEERAELAERAAALESQLHHERASIAFYRKAIAAGVSDPDRLVGIVNLSGVTFDEAGNAQGIDEILSAVVSTTPKTKPQAIGDGTPWNNDEDSVSKTQMLQAAAERAHRTGRAEDMAAYTELKHKLNK